MPAHNSEFPWLSYYGNYSFFERVIAAHDKVSKVNNTGVGLYNISLCDGRMLKVFICECYAFGGAEYYETVQKVGPVDAIIINSNWCGYSFDLKISCMDQKVGIFDINGFMGAINKINFWEYMTEWEKKCLKT